MSDSSADSFDQASEQEDKFREQAVQAARARNQIPKDFAAPDCYDCGDEIPAERLKLGCYRCIGCQTAHEKKTRAFARN